MDLARIKVLLLHHVVVLDLLYETLYLSLLHLVLLIEPLLQLPFPRVHLAHQVIFLLLISCSHGLLLFFARR